MQKYSICFISFFFLFFFCLINLFYMIYFVMNNMILFLEWELVSLNSTSIIMSILLDWMSLLFMMFVTLISSVVIYYSKSYMSSELNLNRFIILVLLFVFSMVLLIISPNIISIFLVVMMNSDLMMIFIGGLILILGVLIGVAYLVLLERKILGYIQIRKGPNKVGFMGLLQPFSDAIKLFTKEQTYPSYSNYMSYYFSPVIGFILSLLIWVLIPYYFNLISFNLGVLFFFCCTSLGVYTVMVAGWSSNSNYALLGGLRAVAQTISYEVSLALIFLSSILMVMNFNLLKFSDNQNLIWIFFYMLPLGLCWLSSSMAETNRTPFDFAEGESELVSGFNIEYSSGGFALIFLAEYSSILFMSLLFTIIYLGGYNLTLVFYLKLSFISFLFIWVRGTLPRYRYDKLMYLAWKSYLPISLNFLMFYLGLKIFLSNFFLKFF